LRLRVYKIKHDKPGRKADGSQLRGGLKNKGCPLAALV